MMLDGRTFSICKTSNILPSGQDMKIASQVSRQNEENKIVVQYGFLILITLYNLECHSNIIILTLPCSPHEP